MTLETLDFNILYKIFSLACFSWVFTNYELIQDLIQDFLLEIPNKPFINIFIIIVRKLLTCTKCFALTFTLIYTLDIWQASITCILATFLDNKLSITKL